MSARSTAGFIVLCLLLVSLPGLCGQREVVGDDPDPISAQKRAADRRLEQPVSIASPRICIGELLDRLSEQTGVKLASDEKDEASGVRVAVFLQKVPLADVMNAVWSLMSYKNAYWAWDQTGDPGAYSYRFRQPRTVKDLPARLRQEAQNAFEKEAFDLVAAVKMTPEQRKQLDDPDNIIKNTLPYKQTMAGLNIFGDTFSSDQQRDILRGERPQEIPLSQLSSSMQAYIQSAWKEANPTITLHNADGTEETVTGPRGVRFSADRNKGDISPCLFFDIVGIGGPAIAGGHPLEKVLRKKTYDQWLLPGDESVNTQEKVKAAPAKAPSERKPNSRTIEERLSNLAEAAPLALIARLPMPERNKTSTFGGDGAEGRDYVSGPYSVQVGRYLSLLELFPPHLIHKWRDNVLLLQPAGWFMDEPNSLDYASIKHIRTLLQKDNGIVAIRDLAEIAHTFSKAQITALAGEEAPLFTGVARMRDLFAFCYEHPRMASETGVPLDEEARAVLRVTDLLAKSPHMAEGQATAVRLKNEPLPHSDPPILTTFIQFRLPDGTWKNTAGFTQKMPPPLQTP